MAIEDLIPILAPEFVNDSRMPAALTLAGTNVAVDHCYHDQVVVLMAAHILTMADRSADGNSQVGAATSLREGGLSVSFGDSGVAGPLGTTGYGVEIDRLNKLCYGLGAMTAWTPAFPTEGGLWWEAIRRD